MMHNMPLVSRLLSLLGIALIISACSQTPSPQISATPTVNRSMPTVLATPQPTTTATPTLPSLGPVPQNCPVSNPIPHMTLSGLGPVIGTSPVWADWPRGGVIAHLSQADPETYEPPYGWAILKTIWEVGPNYTHPVTVRGHDLFDHTLLLFQFDNTPLAGAVLDAQHPNHPWSVVGDGWAEWGSDFVVPKAGCYVVEVSWPAGHWSVTFAAGA